MSNRDLPTQPKALLFGSIGVLLETSEMQYDAFNQAFEQAGLDWHWEKPEYLEMLKTPGGKRRIEAYAEARDETVDAEDLHRRKSQIFRDRLDEGVAPRHGVVDLMRAAKAHGLKLGFVTTTSESNVMAVLEATEGILKRSDFDFVGSDDLVRNGKPAPDIYHMALDQLSVPASEAVAIEDMPASAEASIAAGIATVAFPGEFADGTFEGVAETVDRLDPKLFGLDDTPQRKAG